MNLFKNISIFIIVTGILALHPSLNRGKNAITHLQYLVYGNSVHLSCDESIKRDKVTVKWECEHEHIDCVELTIIKNGQKLAIYYDNKIIGTLYQNKLASNQAHQYTINVTSIVDTVSFEGSIAGPSPSYTPEVIELAFN